MPDLTLTLGALNVHGCSTIVDKRSEIGAMFARRKIDMLSLNETKMKGTGEREFGDVIGRVSGVVNGRAREGVALLVSERMQDCVKEWKEVSARLMWVRMKLGHESWVFVSAYGPGSERSEQEVDEFWSDLSECVGSFRGSDRIVVLGDLNARVGDEVVENIVGRYGVPGRNESGVRLLDICAERELVIGNSMFKKKEVNKYTWVRVDNGRMVERAVMDYVLIERGMVGRLLDVHVFRGEAGGMSDHFLVEGRLRVRQRWMGGKNVKGAREVVNVRKLYEVEKEREFQDKMKVEYEVVKNERIDSVEAEWLLLKNAVTRCSNEVCGMRRVGVFARKGSEWWSEDVKKVVADKRRAFEEWLQERDDMSYERYRIKRNLVKQVVKEAKRVADRRWGMRLSGNFEENKKMFWKEVKRVRKGEI